MRFRLSRLELPFEPVPPQGPCCHLYGTTGGLGNLCNLPHKASDSDQRQQPPTVGFKIIKILVASLVLSLVLHLAWGITHTPFFGDVALHSRPNLALTTPSPMLYEHSSKI